jgi:hypothetical protein
MEDGHQIAGSPYLPGTAASYNRVEGLILHLAGERGLMNKQFDFIDRYSAVALNLIAGRRATHGNAVAPANLGVIMDDLPTENELTQMDTTGAILASADVSIYQSVGVENDAFSAFTIDDTPDLRLTANAHGGQG